MDVSSIEDIKKKFEGLKREIEMFRSDKKREHAQQLPLFDDLDIDDAIVIVQFQIKKFNKENFEEEVQYDIEVAPADIDFKLFERDFNDFINDPKLIEVYSYELV